jgi:TolA-binding protein
LSSEAGKSAEAAAWFERYLVAWPNDTLAEQATGRLLELYPALGDSDSAARIAERYLDRYPSGMRKSLAQRILAGRGAEARR